MVCNYHSFSFLPCHYIVKKHICSVKLRYKHCSIPTREMQDTDFLTLHAADMYTPRRISVSAPDQAAPFAKPHSVLLAATPLFCSYSGAHSILQRGRRKLCEHIFSSPAVVCLIWCYKFHFLSCASLRRFIALARDACVW